MSKNSYLLPAIVIGGFVAFVLIYSSTYIVTPSRQAIVVQLGNPVREVKEPGLHFKLPFVQSVIMFEKRIMELRGASGEVITSDRKRIEVEAFARFKISNPLQFYRNLRDQDSARTQLQAKLNSQLKNTIGAQSFTALLSADRLKVMNLIREGLTKESANLGVQVVDVRIRRADLPAQNQEAVFNRMKTEREQEAAETRAKGNEDAQTKRAAADRRITIIRAEANQQAEILRGEGDAAKNKILGDAYSKDANFFAFYRSLKAYEQAMSGNNTTMLLSPDSPFFRYFRQNPGQEQ
jgi:modulator of FtsH protease HflC